MVGFDSRPSLSSSSPSLLVETVLATVLLLGKPGVEVVILTEKQIGCSFWRVDAVVTVRSRSCMTSLASF